MSLRNIFFVRFGKSDDIISKQQLFYISAVYLFQQRFYCRICEQTCIGSKRLSVTQGYSRIEQITDIVCTAPYLGNASVYSEQSIDSLHSCAYRVFGSEYSITLGLSKLSKKCEIDSTVRHNIGTVACLTGHKECCHIGHHYRNGIAAVLCYILYLVNIISLWNIEGDNSNVGNEISNLAGAVSKIVENDTEDPDERRKRIEAGENGSDLGTVLGLGIGIIANAVNEIPEQEFDYEQEEYKTREEILQEIFGEIDYDDEDYDDDEDEGFTMSM